MCGIAGFSGDFDEALLMRMHDALVRRGPDDGGTWIDADRRVGLTHRRLSIIDLSPRGRQPMWDVTGTVAITYNGEIYNYRELRAELVENGYRFQSDSDTEVLLNLYLRDGAKFLDRLNGIFALALWDTRDESLLVARDGFGVKPLYYGESSRGIVFASELKAVLQEASIPREIDHEAVRHHLLHLWCPSPLTMLRSVRKLEPGFAMRVRNGRIREHWQFYELPRATEHDFVDWPEGDIVVQTRKALTRAVERQLVSDVPIGAFLSGGLDSSGVVALAQRAMGSQRLQCFTIGFPGREAVIEGMAEDLPYAQDVARHLDVDLHTIQVGPEMVEKLPEMIFLLDEPQADPAPINALFISQLAREHGIKVLLSGAGGDDVFTGYRRHYALLAERYWTWLPRAARRRIARASARIRPTSEALRRLSKAFRYADLDTDARIASYFNWIAPELIDSVLQPDVRAGLSDAPTRRIEDALTGLPPDTHALNRMLHLELKFFLADHNLNYVDKMCMASGVEARVPYLDRDLVGLAARLPIEMKQRGRVGKYALRRAMEIYLPRSVIHRPKTGFGAPLRHWMRHDLRPIIDEVLSPKALEHRGLFDPTETQALVAANARRDVDATYSIFSMICIELWCRMFIDQATPTLTT